MSERATFYYAADRLAIRELIEAYAHCADRRDAKRQMTLYSTQNIPFGLARGMFGPSIGSRVLRIADELQRVPVLDRLALGVHLVDIDAGDPGVGRVIVEEIEKVHVRPDVVADRDDLVDDNARPGALSRDLAEELAERDGPSAISGLCWMYAGGRAWPCPPPTSSC